MRLCAACTTTPEAWESTAPPGRCSECGRRFDASGTPIPEQVTSCPVHDPVLASCPHAEEDASRVPTPAPSWLADTSDPAEAR